MHYFAGMEMPSDRKSMSDRLSNTPGKRDRLAFPAIFPSTTTSVSSETPASVGEEGEGWGNSPEAGRERERGRGREDGRKGNGQKGRRKIRSLMKVACASTRNVRGAVRETFSWTTARKTLPPA
jgi:hypothetical protein